MSISGHDEPRHQSFYGPASFGGDNKGIINNVLLDPSTRAMLEKLSKKAPELAALLKRALRDGFISPDVAEALMLAARNINEDVADALLIAGQNINEEVADHLMVAGQNINQEVANKFVHVKNELNNTADELVTVLDSLRETVGQLSGPQERSDPDYQLGPAGTVAGTDQGTRTKHATIRPSLRSADKWWLRFRLICGSFGVGVLTGAILLYHHLGIYATLATLAGALISVFPTLHRIAKALWGTREDL